MSREAEKPTRTGATGELFSGGRLECRKLAEGLEQHRCLPVCVGGLSYRACPESHLGFLTMADAS